MNTFALNPAESFLPTTAESSPQQTLFPWLPGKPATPESAWTRNMWRGQARQFAVHSRDRQLRDQAHLADRIRSHCYNHPVRADYAWRWPDESWINYEPIPLAVPGELQYRHFLTDLYRQISLEIARGLSKPGRVFQDRYSVRVEFMQRIAWVAIRSPCAFRTEARDRHGHWQLTTPSFTLRNLLQSADWIDQVLMPWLPKISLLPEQEVQAGYDWLRASLRAQFHNPRWLKGLKRQLRYHLDTLPEFNHLLVHFGRLQGSLDLGEAQYRELHEHRVFWGEIHQRHPGLSYFYYLAAEYGMVNEGDDLGVLRQKCLEQSLSRAAWRFLVRYGPVSFRAAIDSSLSPEHVCENSMNFIEWQTRAGLDQPLPILLGRNFIATCGLYLTPEQVAAFDPRIARAASDHWNQLPNTGERRRFAAHDWVQVLLWLRDQQPQFDRNQWRAGWPAIWRAYLKWQSLHGDVASWQSCLAAFDWKDWRVTPLTSSYQLAMEGLRMRHCVSSYADRCIAGRYRLFSVTCQFTGRHLATAGLKRKDDAWGLGQVKGPCNREPVQAIRDLARQILRRYQSAEQRALEAERQAQQPVLCGYREVAGFQDLRVTRFSGPALLQLRGAGGHWLPANPDDYPLPHGLRDRIQQVSSRLAAIPSFVLPDEEEWQALDDLVCDLCAELRVALPRRFRVFRDDGIVGGEVEVVEV